MPGLYFLGLPWLNTWGSGRFLGIAEDAQHLAKAIAGRERGADRSVQGCEHEVLAA